MSSSITLYEVSAMYQKCLDEANDYAQMNNGDTDPALEAKLEALGMAKDAKVENTIRYIKNRRAESEAIQGEIERLVKRQHTIDRDVEWCTGYLGTVVGAGNKVKLACGTIGWRSSTSVNIINETAIPDAYKENRVTVYIDKRKIKEAIDAGVEVNGAELLVKQNINIK